MNIRVERLTESNFSDYETLTNCESGGGCYCSFWHQKISSMQEWDQRKNENPMLNRQIVLDKVKTGFHVGVLAYEGTDLLAWTSVGPLTDFYWTWKRMIQIGDDAKQIAGITCFTISPGHRGKGLQSVILAGLKDYGRQQGWIALEGYPFDASAIEKHKEHVLWPGLTKGFEEAGFERIGAHWLNSAEAERSIYKVTI